MVASCVIKEDFSDAQQCDDNTLIPNISYSDLFRMADEGPVQILEDLHVEGYVISSDLQGNFFKSIHIQEGTVPGSLGLVLETELRDSHLLYPFGSRVLLKLHGLYLDVNRGSLKVGGVTSSFGSLSIGRIPSKTVNKHLIVSCEPPSEISVGLIRLDQLSESHLNTLVAFESVEFVDEELGKPFAEPEEETTRTIRNCSGTELGVLNSGYSDFSSVSLPQGNGNIKGLLLREGSKLVLKIRDTSDVDFRNERCPNFGNFRTTDSILITEIADPDNNAGARFVELYNSGSQDFYLNGWRLGRYTNANTDLSSEIDLSGFLIRSNEALVMSSNPTVFEEVYGFPPDYKVISNSAADSNGDDNLDLIDPFGKVIDRFGIPGEDGTGTNHEFEDGGAFRRVVVQKANPDYNFEEWIIYNDTGAEGTINQTLNAPQDYGPGER